MKMYLLFWHIWGVSYKLECVNPRKRYPKSGIPHTLRAKSIHQVWPMLSECASKNSFYICIVIPARKDFSPGTRSRSPPWLSMIFRTEKVRFHDHQMYPFGRGMFFPPARPDRRKCFQSSKSTYCLWFRLQ